MNRGFIIVLQLPYKPVPVLVFQGIRAGVFFGPASAERDPCGAGAHRGQSGSLDVHETHVKCPLTAALCLPGGRPGLRRPLSGQIIL